VVLIRILALLLEWEQIYRTSKLEMLMNWCSFLEARIQEPMRITNVEATGGGEGVNGSRIKFFLRISVCFEIKTLDNLYVRR
jgi:hypothetical protein